MKMTPKENNEYGYTNWLCEPETPEEREALVEMALHASNWRDLLKDAANEIYKWIYERAKENGDN